MVMLRHMKWSFLVLVGSLIWAASAVAAETAAFITFGDWGYGTQDQRAVADAATRYCKQQPCEFVLTLGDNFYNFGVWTTRDFKWKSYYKDIYKDLNLPFYAAIGNHDERGRIQAQIDYHKVDPSWNMPGPYYSIKIPSAPSAARNPVVEIFVINNGDDEFQPDEKLWLEKALKASTATWRILALHKPIISNGSRGDDSSGINDQLVPVICGKIDIVLSGHDHFFSHLRGPWKGCMQDQLIVGTGGKSLRRVTTEDPRTLSAGSFYGFGWISATPKMLTFKMIKTDGTAYYETSWKK